MVNKTKTEKIREEYIETILINQRNTGQKTRKELENLLFVLDDLILQIDQTVDYLFSYLQKRISFDSKTELEKLKRKRKNKKKGIEDEDDDEDSEEDASEEEGGESDEEKQNKYLLLYLKYKELITEYLLAKKNTYKVFKKALYDTYEGTFDNKMIESRLDMFVPMLKEEYIRDKVEVLTKTRKSYKEIFKKITIALKDENLLNFLDVSSLKDMSFIDAYKVIDEQTKVPYIPYIISFEENYLSKVKDIAGSMIIEVFETLGSMYKVVLDNHIRMLMRKYQKKHNSFLGQLGRVQKTFQDDSGYLKDYSQKTIDKIKKMVSN